MESTQAPLPASQEAIPDLNGRAVGPYRVLEAIGHGGMAAVYKAYQPSMDRLVALKVIFKSYDQSPALVERFEQEARLIGKLEHPNIVPVYDAGQQDGILFLAMRYMRAGTVQDLLARGPLSLHDAAQLMTDIAAALDYAHSLNIVHRDIKPGNILVDAHGHAHLADFGLAKVLDGNGQLTHTGATMGTPAYIAPEQALGIPVTPQSDIYALGVMLYQMLTGELPFSADTPMALALMHIQGQLRWPREVNPAITPAAELVIVRAMSKDPADRYQTAGEMAAALEQAAQLEAAGASLPIPLAEKHLATLAGEIAQSKAPEEVTPEVRRELRAQERRARNRRLLAFLPWVLVGCLVIGLSAAFLASLNAGRASGDSAAQTATAVNLLLGQLSAAQTAAAGGGAGLEPTLAYLQTQLAGAPGSSTPATPAATPSATSFQAAATGTPGASPVSSSKPPSSTPPPVSNPPTSTKGSILPLPTIKPKLPTSSLPSSLPTSLVPKLP